MPTGIEQALTRHQIQLQRLAGGNYKLIIPILKDMSGDLRSMILGTGTETERLRRIINTQAKAIINESVNKMTDILFPEFEELAVYEEQFVRKIYDSAIIVELTGLSVEQLKASVSGSKMTLFSADGSAQRLTIEEAFKQFDSRIVEDLKRKVAGGYASGQTSQQIARDVFRMTNGRTRKQAESLVRTCTNHIGSVARQSLYKENEEIIKGERYVATLDSRTSLFCITHDGKFYHIGEGPQTPAHFGCRSIRIAEVLDKYKIPGLAETRASQDGLVPASENYGSFLKKQDTAFQDEVLGKQRAELFRSGKVQIDQFTDFGRVLTVSELKSKYL